MDQNFICLYNYNKHLVVSIVPKEMTESLTIESVNLFITWNKKGLCKCDEGYSI